MPIVSGVPVIVTFLSGQPSSALEILMLAPDNCLQKEGKIQVLIQCTGVKFSFLS